MTYVFGARSSARLAECHPDLAAVAHRALSLSLVDFSIITGHRGREAQQEAFQQGFSRVQWPNGRHNRLPSHALDFAPYPHPYSDDPRRIARFYCIAAAFWAASKELAIPVRLGIDWDRDGEILTDQTFNDLGHVELAH
ncbi:MAG: M15 family peptidase [Myxococcota bacterium]